MEGLATSYSNKIVETSPKGSEIATTSPFDTFPEDLIREIFSYLNARELTKCTEVNRRWRILASSPTLWNAIDLRKISPRLKVFDESSWAIHVDLAANGLSVEDAEPLDKGKAIPKLKKMLSTVPIEGKAAISVFTIPKGLSIQKMSIIAESPKKGYKTELTMTSAALYRELFNKEIEKTYRVAITNFLIEGTRGLSIADLVAHVKEKGCAMPSALEMVALLALTFIETGERLYPADESLNYTYCEESISNRDSEMSPSVGGFSSGGFSSKRGFLVNLDDISGQELGAAGVLRDL